MPNFGDYQNEIYFAGLCGVVPSFPMRFEELEARAHEAMPSVVSYVAAGCGDERTQDANVTAFGKWGLVPRMLVGATRRDLSIELFGMKLPTPLFMSPIGVIGLCAQDGHGDIATARAAAATGAPMVASTLMVDPLEVVAAELGCTPGFFPAVHPDRPRACSEPGPESGAGWVQGDRGYVGHLANRLAAPRPRDLQFSATSRSRARELPYRPTILRAARRAIGEGMDGIYCSNHGGRQANGGLAALDLLPDVVKAAGPAAVLVHPGVRSGCDVVNALAPGPTPVVVGRPYAYGLALGGVDGIVHILRSFLAEADLCMAIDGYPTRADLRPEVLRRAL